VNLWLEEWDDFQYLPEEVTDAGDRVLMRVRLSGRGKTSGVGLDATVFSRLDISGCLAVAVQDLLRRRVGPGSRRAAGVGEVAAEGASRP
jgi:hypothetical protein